MALQFALYYNQRICEQIVANLNEMDTSRTSEV